MAYRGYRGRGRGGRESRGRRGNTKWRGGGGWRRDHYSPPEPEYPEFYPLIRPIFDWTEVGKEFPQAASVLEDSFLTQLLSEHAAHLSQSMEDQSTLQEFITKVCTVVDNMLVSGEGDLLLLDEVRVVGPQKMGIALAGDMVGEVVILLRDLPTPALVSKISGRIVECLDSDHKERMEEGRDGYHGDSGPVTLTNETNYSFEIHSSKKAVAKVYLTTTGEIVYGGPRRDRNITDMSSFESALRMVRHTRWWDDQTSHIERARDLVRILVAMKKHVPGLNFLSTWYIQILSHCAIVPLVGNEPLSLLGGFRRIWELLSAGLFLPGSVGIPDPCEDGNHGIHENLPHYQLDELTRNSQMILQMISFGAYREVLAMEGATPVNFMEPYSFGGVTLGVPAPAFERPPAAEVQETKETDKSSNATVTV